MSKKKDKKDPKKKEQKKLLKSLKIAKKTKSKCCESYKKGEDKRCSRCPKFDLIKKLKH